MLIGTVPSRYSNAPQECTPLLPGTVCAGGRNRERCVQPCRRRRAPSAATVKNRGSCPCPAGTVVSLLANQRLFAIPGDHVRGLSLSCFLAQERRAGHARGVDVLVQYLTWVHSS